MDNENVEPIKAPYLSVVVPLYFEESCIGEFVKQLGAVLREIPQSHEVIFVDDGSTDQTIPLLEGLIEANADLTIGVVVLAHNHGKPAALMAGIEHARGEAVLCMDPDLQDPPKHIPQFIAKLEEGYDLVYGVLEQKQASWMTRMLSRGFYWFLEIAAGLTYPQPLSTMRIFSRAFVREFLRYREVNRFMEGILHRVGMRQTHIMVPHAERFAGTSKFTLRRRLALAFSAIVDFSDLPLRIALRFGAVMVVCSFMTVIGLVAAKWSGYQFDLGWPSIVALILFTGGVNLLFLGFIGAYVGRCYQESKRRPIYSVQRRVGLEEPPCPGS